MNAVTPVWHEGERILQRSVGVAERMEELGGRVIRPYLLEQHRNFYPQLPFVVLGTVDTDGDAWATIRAGMPGFLSSPDPLTLHIETPKLIADPAEAGLNRGDAIGVLGIELHTRRRNRLNGIVRRRGYNAVDIDVQQSFGNCPQYITVRDVVHVPDAVVAPEVTTKLDARARNIITAADTFFVASYVDLEAGRQVDVSHRGGQSGFVQIDSDDTLVIPDYSGNRFFNTLGNIITNPRAGLVFVDFPTGTLLQVTGDATVSMDASETAAMPGAERIWRVRPHRIVYRPNALPLRWR